jgi:hypothetical protein
LQVYIYRKEAGVPYMVEKTLVGEKVGEFFGGSLAVADVNGDGLDDLIVGAPMYTISHDEGRIYVFIANSQVRYILVNTEDNGGGGGGGGGGGEEEEEDNDDDDDSSGCIRYLYPVTGKVMITVF